MLLMLDRAVCFYSPNPVVFLEVDEASATGAII